MSRRTRWIAMLIVGAVLAGCAGVAESEVDPVPASVIGSSTVPDSVRTTVTASGPSTSIARDAETTTTTVPSPASTFPVAEPTAMQPAGDVLSPDAVDGLLWMREEEKLARDVYQALSELWNLPIFANIADSEQTHTDAVGELLDRYGIPDPMADDTSGVFVDPAIQALYDDLVEQGSNSLVEALIVGATIEDMDIVDLQLRRTGVEEIDLVYANLEKGSRNHLRAFIRTLERQGGGYVPAYLTVAEYEAIISSPTERGRSEA